MPLEAFGSSAELGRVKKDLITIVKSLSKGRTNVHKMVLSLTVADLIISYIVIPLEIGWRISVQVLVFL